MGWLMSMLLTVPLLTEQPKLTECPSSWLAAGSTHEQAVGSMEPVIPEVAEAMSGLMPVGLGFVALGSYPHQPYVAAGVTALSLGAGHLYVGDFKRAGAVALGGGALIGVTSFGAIHYLRSRPFSDSLEGMMTFLLYVVGPTAIYAGWAGQDAYETAVRHNLIATGWHAPLAVPKPRPWFWWQSLLAP
ncbi:hypothetical protein D3C72_801260 [compost metagenome]